MAKYSGTFSCGHEGRVDVVGPTKNRQWIVDRKFEGMCPECYEIHLQEQREKANIEASEKAKEMELPILQGSDKQVAWANTLRQKLIDKVESKIKAQKDNKTIEDFIFRKTIGGRAINKKIKGLDKSDLLEVKNENLY